MFDTKSFKVFRQFTLIQYRFDSPQLNLDLLALFTIALQVAKRRNIKKLENFTNVSTPE